MNTKDIRRFISLHPFLLELRNSDGAVRQTELSDRTGKSKSTTHRGTKRLEEAGVVRKGGGGYVLTEFGRVVADRTCSYVSEIEAAEEYDEFLCVVRETDLPLECITEADVTRASEQNPVAPLLRVAEVAADAEDIRVLTNSIAPKGFEVGRQGIRKGEKSVEMVVDRRTVESMRGSRWFGEELRKDLRTEGFDLWVHEGPVPYQIGVMDGCLCLGAEDDDRMPVAVLETKEERAVDWAVSVFERYRGRAERLRNV